MKRTAHCPCGGKLRFATDLLGRTVEQCAGCGYEGLVRLVGGRPPIIKRHRVPPVKYDRRQFRCGHWRSPENTYTHPRGWTECRACARERTRKAGIARQQECETANTTAWGEGTLLPSGVLPRTLVHSRQLNSITPNAGSPDAA